MTDDASREFVLVTEYFHPDTASTGQLLTDLAVGLQDRGLDLTVYTSQPNYHSGDNERQPRVTEHNGVTVKRIRAPQLRQNSFVRRAFNWIVFTVWMLVVLLIDRADREREVLFVSNPPILPAAMWLVCKVRGWGYTYIVYDLYPDFAVETGYFEQGGVVDTVWSALTRAALRGATHVVTLGPVMRDRVVQVGGPGLDDEKVEIIHNWEDESFVEPVHKSDNWFSEEQGLVEEFTVLYSGNIGENHDLETVVRAAQAFDDEPVTFLIIGEGDAKDSTVELAERLGVRGSTVRFLPYQPFEDLPYTLTSGDVSVVTVEEGMEGVCVSSKLYTALAAGEPVLVVSQSRDDEARIVQNHDAGIQVPQGGVEEAVAGIDRWRSNPELVDEHGRNARQAFEQHFTKDRAIEQYYELLIGDCTSEDPG